VPRRTLNCQEVAGVPPCDQSCCIQRLGAVPERRLARDLANVARQGEMDGELKGTRCSALLFA
jgi:hypothetical protein